jgi:enolase-phosphatase E1
VTGSDQPARAILLDIEGTITPIAFVTGTLFPYARAHLPAFLEREGRSSELSKFLALMDRDSKTPELKELQGRIWEEGYARGEIVAPLYPDVPPALDRWRRAGIVTGIFSSGSVVAQRSLLRCSSAGDLTAHIRWYFDTRTGPKQDASSYERIAREMNVIPAHVVFVSDVVAELDAAHAAGMQPILSNRPGNAPQPPNAYRAIGSFDEISCH